MGYREALEAAGAVVHEYEQFGSYQGDWWARVTYQDKTGWVSGSYGSCSVCDAFEGEFGWYKPTQERLAAFGQEYLDNFMTQEEAEKSAARNLDWDYDAKEMFDFIKSHGR